MSTGGRTACIDVGSTFTKGALVSSDGELIASAECATTVGAAGDDVMAGLEDVRTRLGAGADVPLLVCSSAGGGLRLAVVGYEQAVTAHAGHRVGLSAGARVVHVSAGPLDPAGLSALLDVGPDVVLLVGGTDGGNADVLLHNARVLARSALRAPVVVAGNVAARDEVCAALARGRKRALPTANVLPRIGVLDPQPARAAIREVFIRHVIGGKGLSRGPRFARLVRAATPDAVLAGVELLADGPAGGGSGLGDVLVVDVGGATTDVYSVVTPEDDPLRREVVEVMWRSRTVEGDLGMRWNAPGVLEAALAERLVGPEESAGLAAAVRLRHDDPSWLPGSDADRATEATLARLAVTVALRRHGRPPSPTERAKDLRRVAAVVGSGGVLRHASPAVRERVLAPARTDHAGGWPVAEHARLLVDTRYVLAAAGLLGLAGSATAGARLAASVAATVPPVQMTT